MAAPREWIVTGWRFGELPPDAQAARPEAHESLVSRETVAEVPLTGLSFILAASFWPPTDLIILPPTSSRFSGAAPVRRIGLGHFSFIIERRCIQHVVATLAAP